MQVVQLPEFAAASLRSSYSTPDPSATVWKLTGRQDLGVNAFQLVKYFDYGTASAEVVFDSSDKHGVWGIGVTSNRKPPEDPGELTRQLNLLIARVHPGASTGSASQTNPPASGSSMSASPGAAADSSSSSAAATDGAAARGSAPACRLLTPDLVATVLSRPFRQVTGLNSAQCAYREDSADMVQFEIGVLRARGAENVASMRDSLAAENEGTFHTLPFDAASGFVYYAPTSVIPEVFVAWSTPDDRYFMVAEEGAGDQLHYSEVLAAAREIAAAAG